jgi:hypothetical protein
MTDSPYSGAIAALERELAETQALIDQLKQRVGAEPAMLSPEIRRYPKKVEPLPAATKKKRNAAPAQKKTDDAAEARKAKSRDYMRRKRAAAKAARAAAAEPPDALPGEVVVSDELKSRYSAASPRKDETWGGVPVGAVARENAN